MNKYTKELVLIILGSNNPSFDGITMKESYSNSHLESIKTIANFFQSAGIDIGYVGQELTEEAAFDIVKNGHIVFLNADPIAYLKLPKQISKKQYEVLEIIQEELRNYNLYVQTLEPVNEEAFVSEYHEKSYVLKKKNFKIKDRK